MRAVVMPGRMLPNHSIGLADGGAFALTARQRAIGDMRPLPRPLWRIGLVGMALRVLRSPGHLFPQSERPGANRAFLNVTRPLEPLRP